jgi:hypothetical protein
MTTLTLPQNHIHYGSLILVNQEYGFVGHIEDMLMPVQECFPSIKKERRAVVLVAIHTSPLTSFCAETSFLLTRILDRDMELAQEVAS